MDIRIEKSYQVRIPFDVEASVRKLLHKIPNEHLLGLAAIILVDQVTHKRNKKSGGLYLQKKGQDPAKIEIAIDSIYKGVPKFIFFLPFIVKFMLANVLFHEIGHHYMHHTHGVTKREEENFAEKYRKQMLKRTFFWWRLLLLPLSPLIRWLNRIAHRGTNKQEVRGSGF